MRPRLTVARLDWRLLGMAMLIGLLVFAPAAVAHGLGSEDPNRPVIDYLWLGTKHLLAGWDHLLFILGVVLVSASLWRATKMLSLFVLGHSLTLAIATFEEWQVSTTFVDIVVTLSVAAVAVAGLQRSRRINWRMFGSAMFAFGLIHGLGLSTRLQELGVTDDALFWRVLLFNIGVEIGQAIAVLGFAAIGWLIVNFYGNPVKLRQPAFMTIALAGLIGAMILSLPGPSGEETIEQRPVVKVEEKELATCQVVNAVTKPSGVGSSHPERRFYEPGEEYPAEEFGHSMLDGYVVVTYRPNIGEGDLEALRSVVEGNPEGLLGGAEPGQKEALLAKTVSRELRCISVDTDALEEFRAPSGSRRTVRPAGPPSLSIATVCSTQA